MWWTVLLWQPAKCSNFNGIFIQAFWWYTIKGGSIEREEGLRLPVHLSSPLTNIVFLPTLHTDNLHFLARHAILPNKRLLKQAVKNVAQSQHTSRSGTSLRNFPRETRSERSHERWRPHAHPQHLYEQMTAFTERNGAIAYFLYSCSEQNSLVMYRTLLSLYVVFGLSILWL